MSVSSAVSTDHQLARLLQIGMVLEEVVEARADKHLNSMDDTLDAATCKLLEDAATEAADHRATLERLVNDLEADPVSFDRIQGLVEARYGKTRPEDFDDVLYDQLCNEETAYKFYDDLLASIEASDATFGIDRDRLVAVLRQHREQEAEGVEAVTRLMERSA